MRKYAQILPKFWTGKTGKEIRALGLEARVIATYLFTGPHATMTGLYYLPIPTLVHESGCPSEGASKAMHGLRSIGFFDYDDHDELAWVPSMARHQIAESLKPRDKRIKWIVDLIAPFQHNVFAGRFVALYGQSFNLPTEVLGWGLEGPSQDPPKPLIIEHRTENTDQSKSVRPDPDQAGAHDRVRSKPRRKPDDKPSSDFTKAKELYETSFAMAYGKPPQFEAAEGAILSSLIRAHGFDEVRARMTRAFKYPPDFPKHPHDLRAIKQHWNKYLPVTADPRNPIPVRTDDEYYKLPEKRESWMVEAGEEVA